LEPRARKPPGSRPHPRAHCRHALLAMHRNHREGTVAPPRRGESIGQPDARAGAGRIRPRAGTSPGASPDAAADGLHHLRPAQAGAIRGAGAPARPRRAALSLGDGVEPGFAHADRAPGRILVLAARCARRDEPACLRVSRAARFGHGESCRRCGRGARAGGSPRLAQVHGPVGGTGCMDCRWVGAGRRIRVGEPYPRHGVAVGASRHRQSACAARGGGARRRRGGRVRSRRHSSASPSWCATTTSSRSGSR
jgi:hypothetical protein